MQLSNRDGKTAHEGRDPTREYYSRRHPGYLPWGRIGKEMTHKKERAIRRRMIAKLRRVIEIN
jgi:hypothetical protein